MSCHITFPLQDGKISLGKAGNICFGCGKMALLQKEIYFEDHESFKPLGKLDVLMERTVIAVPICENCSQVISYCIKKILIWSGVFFVCLAVSFVAVSAFKFDEENKWPVIILIGSGILPVYKIKKFWSIKDRGGDFVGLMEKSKFSVTLAFNNLTAYEKVSAINKR